MTRDVIATITRRPAKNNGAPADYLTIDSAPLRINRGRNHSSYITVDGTRVAVKYNEYILESWGGHTSIPMVLFDGAFEMLYEYEQLPGGASAPYVIARVAER